MTGARWEPDERGRGIADGSALAPGVRELAAALDSEDWIAEEPEVHLLPRVERACAEAGLELIGHELTDGAVFVIRVAWPDDAGQAVARVAAFRIVGSFAELATNVRVRNGGRTFEVVTGMLDGDSRFAGHGHLVRLELVAPE